MNLFIIAKFILCTRRDCRQGGALASDMLAFVVSSSFFATQRRKVKGMKVLEFTKSLFSCPFEVDTLLISDSGALPAPVDWWSALEAGNWLMVDIKRTHSELAV